MMAAHEVTSSFMNRISSMAALFLFLMSCSNVFAATDLPVIQSAASDEQGRITVNGKPFFPILMYDVPTDSESLKMFRAHGFNTLLGQPEVSNRLLANGFYTAVHVGQDPVRNPNGVLFGVGMDSPALHWKEQLLDKARADLAKMRRLVPNRAIMNAIGYWEDEPTGVYENKVPSNERYEELIKVLDVSAPYLYPIPYQPISSVGEALARANSASGGRKPLVPILQLFTWKENDRYPAPVELKCMVYLSLIHGADGIGYFSYSQITGKKGTNIAKEQPELWKAVKQINSEITAMRPALLQNHNVAVALQEGALDVEFRALGSSENILLLLANTASVARTVVLHFPPLGTTQGQRSLKPLAGGQPVLFEAGRVRVSLEPNQALGLID